MLTASFSAQLRRGLGPAEEFLAEQLGVQLGTVTEALAVLHDKKLVDSGYGKIKLVKSKALGKVSCDCFQLAKQAIEEHLHDIQAYKRSLAER